MFQMIYANGEMTADMQELYHDIRGRFPHNFPFLHNITALLQTTNAVFEKWEEPKLLVEQAHYENPQDYECHSIQEDFVPKSRYDLSYQDCSMLLIDASLITDAAFLYYLPGIAHGVFYDGNDQMFFLSRLRTVDTDLLADDECQVLHDLLLATQELEAYWQSLEAEEWIS